MIGVNLFPEMFFMILLKESEQNQVSDVMMEHIVNHGCMICVILLPSTGFSYGIKKTEMFRFYYLYCPLTWDTFNYLIHQYISL